MKVIAIHHRLGGYTSHHAHEALNLQQDLRRRGRKLLLFVNKIADARIVSELHARAVLDDPTFRLEWSFEERSRRFVEMLHAQIDRFVKADDWVLLTVSTQLEAHALARWMRELPPRRKPWIVVLFISDRWNRAGRDEYERQTAEMREAGAAIAMLSPDEARKMIFCAVTEPLAEELSELLGTKVEATVVPMGYQHLEPEPAQRSLHAVPRVAILGGTRREKGSHLIPDIVRACRAHVNVEFLIHLMNNTLTPEEREQLASVEGEAGVKVLHDALTPAEYASAFHSGDLFLFPYEAVSYTKRASGVFIEAVAFGKPVVVTPDTWMARQIEEGRAAGTIAGHHDAESIARAIASCVAQLDALRRSQAALRGAFARDVSLTAFVDFIETTITSRQPAPRRPWWKF